jgi:hypothetical protein
MRMWIGRCRALLTNPKRGDKFAHQSIDNPIGTVDRITQTGDGTIWLWCQGTAYPLVECEPVGIWQALALAFVADLADCLTYGQVTALLDGLEPKHRQAIWNVTPADLRANIHQLKTATLPPEPPIEIKPLPLVCTQKVNAERRVYV